MASGSDLMIPASTLIIARDTPSGPPEMLMLERAGGMRFAAGALVFPGGRLDDDDMNIASKLAHGRDDAIEEIASRIAAIRETIEETGIAIGLDPAPGSDMVAALRAELARGATFSGLLSDAGLSPALDALTLFTRWQPPREVTHRRFDTRFYIAPAPEGVIDVADGTENVRSLWASAEAILADAKAGHHSIIFPTICTLFRLARLQSFNEIAEDARRHGHLIAATEIIERDGGRWYTVPENIGFPVNSLLDGVLPADLGG